eukprot:GHVR01147835.1.p1 GENE.GHVR01147835.1~~GHVR01147835.1.p1  ORF type:complete len:218 (+),score=46.05 GHVR01147835.1:29-655(+)
MESNNLNNFKLISLTVLVVQTSGVIITTRLSKVSPYCDTIPYLNSSVVFFSELLKLFGSFVLVLRENKYNLLYTIKQININIFGNPYDTFIVGIPAILYVIQNNLLFIGMSKLPGSIYQVTYQLKILTTAILSLFFLKKVFTFEKWVALFILTVGAALIQLPKFSFELPSFGSTDAFIGVAAVLAACVTSGFAGVWFERILKSSSMSV